ncbi:MAG TPA: hypothetical protein VK525_03945, partial [Candidatus Saccharimonadales bacterium]|nr:hypothetical protein [Candidatus Saccharimonadales bacterium]
DSQLHALCFLTHFCEELFAAGKLLAHSFVLDGLEETVAAPARASNLYPPYLQEETWKRS